MIDLGRGASAKTDALLFTIYATLFLHELPLSVILIECLEVVSSGEDKIPYHAFR